MDRPSASRVWMLAVIPLALLGVLLFVLMRNRPARTGAA